MSCIFCDIASEVTAANVVFDGGDTLFFNDISPKARVHVVGILKTHMSSLGEINASNSAMVGKLLSDAVVVAEKMGLNKQDLIREARHHDIDPEFSDGTIKEESSLLSEPQVVEISI